MRPAAVGAHRTGRSAPAGLPLPLPSSSVALYVSIDALHKAGRAEVSHSAAHDAEACAAQGWARKRSTEAVCVPRHPPHASHPLLPPGSECALSLTPTHSVSMYPK